MFFLVFVLWQEVFFGEWTPPKSPDRALGRTKGTWQGFLTFQENPKNIDKRFVQAEIRFADSYEAALEKSSLMMVGYSTANDTLIKLRDNAHGTVQSFEDTQKIRILLVMNRTIANISTNPFELSHRVTGTATFIYGDVSVSAREVNHTMILIESSVYGAISGIFIGLLSMVNHECKIRDYNAVSPWCLTMISSYDFGYAVLHYSVGLITRANEHLFFFELVACLLLFGNSFSRGSRAWNATLLEEEAGLDVDRRTRYVNRSRLFFKIWITNVVSGNLFSAAFKNAGRRGLLFALLIGTSCWVPQIVKSASSGGRHVFPIWYPWALSILRLAELWFVLCRRNCIVHYESDPATMSIVTSWSVIQLVMLTCQHYLGGAFFLPQRFRRQEFDYYRTEVSPGSTCAICLNQICDGELQAVTPCNHAFHDVCLRQWMKENLVCPFCRSPIPPIMEPVAV